jgi:hypothetical protein
MVTFVFLEVSFHRFSGARLSAGLAGNGLERTLASMLVTHQPAIFFIGLPPIDNMLPAEPQCYEYP